MTWLGRFLEFSVQTNDVLAEQQNLERLGFQALTTNETLNYAYSALSDGQCTIGLHQKLASPFCLSFVHPNLADIATECRARGVKLTAQELGSERFNYVHFTDPNGIGLQVLSARSFSPPNQANQSELGKYQTALLRLNAEQTSLVFWERLGFRLETEAPVFKLGGLDACWAAPERLPSEVKYQLQFSQGRWPAS